MRRFSLVVLVTALIIILVSPESREPNNGYDADMANALSDETRAARSLKGDRLAVSERANADGEVWPPAMDAEFRVRESRVWAAEPVDTAVAIDADGETVAAGHVTASARADRIEDTLERLTVFDLKTAAQEELKRLGCYTARVDGLWGPKSRAALADFNERVGANYQGAPDPALVAELKAAPSGLCKVTCPDGSTDRACTVASIEDAADSEGQENSGAAYLPPWMRGEKVASTQPDGPISSSEGDAVSEQRFERRRAERIQRYRPRRDSYTQRRRAPGRSNSWLPDNWPGSR